MKEDGHEETPGGTPSRMMEMDCRRVGLPGYGTIMTGMQAHDQSPDAVTTRMYWDLGTAKAGMWIAASDVGCSTRQPPEQESNLDWGWW